ncbi:MAG: SH3 domain-containing protein [Candidatus Dormibacteria bacterium]
MKRSAVLLSLLLSGCAVPGLGKSTATPPAASPVATVSPSPTAQGPLAIWVLSPLGLNLRAEPTPQGKILASVPQGTQLTSVQFAPGDPGWYQVTYQGTQGWVAGKGFTSTHPQLSYASAAAGYYFLYPAEWQAIDRGADAEIDSPTMARSTSPQPQGSTTASNQPPAAALPLGPLLLVHEAASTEVLENTPLTQGSLLTSAQREVYGITTLQRSYSLNGGGFESDVRVQMDATHAVLITFRSPLQNDLATTFADALDSFGVSLVAPAPSPSTSPR